MKKILDSGNRTKFESGAVRDIQTGKGRCDLMPLDVVSTIFQSSELKAIQDYKRTGNARFLFTSLDLFCAKHYEGNTGTMLLEVAKHFEDGAEKYGENNWQKGLPVHSFINSAIRHLLKHKSGWDDEPHDRAFVWNIICAIWTIWHKPELNDYTVVKDGVE